MLLNSNISAPVTVPESGIPSGTLLGTGQRQRRPLGDLNAAMRDLDADADHVRGLLDTGRLIGFDIAARQGNRVCVRILTRSLDHYLQTGNCLEIGWPEIFRLISPGEKFFLTGVEVQRCLNCDQGHVSAMIRAGHLESAKQSRRGRNGSPMLSRASLEKFLKDRRIGYATGGLGNG